MLRYVVIIRIDMLLLQGGKTALHYACCNGHTEVVKHLINNNADISASDNVSDYAVCLLYIFWMFMLIKKYFINSYKEN